MRTERVTVRGIGMTWDAEKRLARLGFETETKATGRDATILVTALTTWVGTGGEPFALLGDGGKLSGVDAEYRSIWGKFFRAHREDSYIAFFNMGPLVRIAAEMFRIGTRLRLKAFSKEPEALSWLREKGFGA